MVNLRTMVEITPEDLAELANEKSIKCAGIILVASEELIDDIRALYNALLTDSQEEEEKQDFSKDDGQNGSERRTPLGKYAKKKEILSIFNNGEELTSSEILDRLNEKGIYIRQKTPAALGQWISRNMDSVLDRVKCPDKTWRWKLKGSTIRKHPAKWDENKEKHIKKILELHETGKMPDSLLKVLNYLNIAPSGKSYKYIKKLFAELGIDVPRKKTKKLTVNLDDEEYILLQKLYTHHTRGEKIWDDNLVPPERRKLRQLEEKGLARCATIEMKDNGSSIRRGLWEIKPKGTEMLEEMSSVTV